MARASCLGHKRLPEQMHLEMKSSPPGLCCSSSRSASFATGKSQPKAWGAEGSPEPPSSSKAAPSQPWLLLFPLASGTSVVLSQHSCS